MASRLRVPLSHLSRTAIPRRIKPTIKPTPHCCVRTYQPSSTPLPSRTLLNPTPSTSSTSSTTSTQGYGQPLPSTHPHLFSNSNELTPGISREEYEDRRKRLIDSIDEGDLVIVKGGRMKYLSGKILYLTGWQEPDSVLVLEKDSSLKGYTTTFFVPLKDPSDEVWNGPRSGREGAIELFGADQAHDISLLARILKSKIENCEGRIWADLDDRLDARGRGRAMFGNGVMGKRKTLFEYLVPRGNESDEVMQVVEMLENGNKKVERVGDKIERLRLIKSEAEIVVMQKAARISAKAHTKVMRFCEPTASSPNRIDENSLVAHFEYHCALQGSPRPAYVPVCASGTSGLTIHYTSNSLPLEPNTLVNLDAGCEYGGYASDITRTFPVSGKFTTAQAHLYEVVLRVQKECIKLCTASKGFSLEELHRKSVEIMRVELTDLGFHLRGGDLERIVYPHFLTHPIGIDLHDTPGFGRGESIKSGMVITIEPGIFVPPHASFPVGFHNLSVRVEDEVLIRENDQVVLSIDAPKEIVDIEKTCQGYFDGLPGQ